MVFLVGGCEFEFGLELASQAFDCLGVLVEWCGAGASEGTIFVCLG